MEFLHTDKAPAAIGPYSQAVETNGFVFTSGQLGIIPDTGALAHSMAAQTVQAQLLEKERYGHFCHTVLHMFSKGLCDRYRVAITSISTKASLGS